MVLLNILQDLPELERISYELKEYFLLSTVRNKKHSKSLHSNRRYTHEGVLGKKSSSYDLDSGVADPDRIDHHKNHTVCKQSSPTPQCEDTHDDYAPNRALQEESIKKKLLEQLEEQGERVSEQDNIIQNLRKDCDQKDEIVQHFKKDRAEKEKIIENLKARCEEAEREQAKNEEKMERIQREHKNEIADLQKNIDELKQKEEDARFELEKAKRILIEAELRKVKEMSELRDTYHQQEKMKLEYIVALKQTEKELVEEMTKHAQELAEEKTKRAQELAQSMLKN